MNDTKVVPIGQVKVRPSNGHPPEEDYPYWEPKYLEPIDPPFIQPRPDPPHDFFDHEPPESAVIFPTKPLPVTFHDPKAPEDYSGFRERVSSLPALHWFARDLFPSEGIVLFHGRPRSMKTLAMQECAYKLSCGVAPFNLPRFKVDRPIRIAYLTEEDSEQLVNFRLDLIEAGTALRPEPGHFIPLIRKGLSLDNPNDLLALRKKIEAAKIELLFMEPMRSLTSQAEKTSSEFKPTLDWIRTLQRETQCKSFALGHHWRKPSKDAPQGKGQQQEDRSPHSERASGSALFSISDCLLAFEKRAWNKTSIIPGDYKLGNDPEAFDVTWETVEAEDSTGKPIFSTYLRAQAETKSEVLSRRGADRNLILDALKTSPWATGREIEGIAKLRNGAAAPTLRALHLEGLIQRKTGKFAVEQGRSNAAIIYALPE